MLFLRFPRIKMNISFDNIPLAHITVSPSSQTATLALAVMLPLAVLFARTTTARTVLSPFWVIKASSSRAVSLTRTWEVPSMYPKEFRIMVRRH